MLLHTESWRQMGVFPTNILDDPDVSVGAKGLYILLYNCNSRIYSLQDLCDKFTTSSKDEVDQYYHELIDAGYITITTNQRTGEEKVTMSKTPHKKKELSEDQKEKVANVTDVVNEKPKNKYEILVAHIGRWELSTNVSNLLTVYFTKWLHKEGGFAEKDDLHTPRVNQLIGNLVAMHLDEDTMLEVIQQSIDRCWCTFVLPKNTTTRPKGVGTGFTSAEIQSASYTPEEIEAIKKKREQLRQNGIDEETY